MDQDESRLVLVPGSTLAGTSQAAQFLHGFCALTASSTRKLMSTREHKEPAMKTLATMFWMMGAATALAQPASPPHGPPPLIEELATIEGLDQKQQQAIHALLSKRSSAHAELDLRCQQQHLQIDTAGQGELRAEIGEDAYRKFAQWRVAQHRGHHTGARHPFPEPPPPPLPPAPPLPPEPPIPPEAGL